MFFDEFMQILRKKLKIQEFSYEDDIMNVLGFQQLTPECFMLINHNRQSNGFKVYKYSEENIILLAKIYKLIKRMEVYE